METNCTFPDDIWEEILSRLPGRQLLIFRCVSKSWLAIVDNPSFMKKHHNMLYSISKEQADIPMLVDRALMLDRDSSEFRACQHYFISKRCGDVLLYATPEIRRDYIPRSSEDMESFRGANCIGCAVGVVLLEWRLPKLGSWNPKLGLWNPTTREFMVVPPRKPRLSKEYVHGRCTLGFDPKSNDFKIVRSILLNSNLREHSYEMYSLNTNSWKSIENPYPIHDPSLNIVDYRFDVGVYINNTHYWPYRSSRYVRVRQYDESYFVLSFDFCNDKFKVLSPPRREAGYSCSLANYNGSLAFICGFGIQQIERLEIWVMTEVDDHGIPHSWQHLFTTGSFPENELMFCSFRGEGEMFITLYVNRSDCGYSCLYDLTTNKMTKRFGFIIFQGYEYVESLFKLTKIIKKRRKKLM